MSRPKEEVPEISVVIRSSTRRPRWGSSESASSGWRGCPRTSSVLVSDGSTDGSVVIAERGPGRILG